MGPDENKHMELYKNLKEEDKVLLMLRDEVYGGSWESLRQDLKDRLEGRPYVVKLAGKIQDDLDRIDKMAEYEKSKNINLADLADHFKEA